MSIALLDGDILRYEVGFSSDIAWEKGENGSPPCSVDFLITHLNNKIDFIKHQSECKDSEIYMTSNKVKGERFFIGETKPYKGNRLVNKPWHYDNLTAMLLTYGAVEVSGIEADDAIASRQCEGDDTVICSRDKDFKQVPGVLYSWEIGHQPEFGPTLITAEEGMKFFLYQMIVGDTSDNIPGLRGKGVRAVTPLLQLTPSAMYQEVKDMYRNVLGVSWYEIFEEQAKLLWLHRKPGEWWSWDVMEDYLDD